MSFNWNTKNYIAEVENGSDSGLQDYMHVELDFVRQVEDLASKTIVDVGAGYGRVLPKLAPLAKAFIAVEKDEDELEELRHRVESQPNSTLIVGSGDDLEKLVPGNLERPLLLSLQNTLGPWDGDREDAIKQLAIVAKKGQGEIIVSLFCQEALKDWGLEMYSTATGVVGKYYAEASDLDRGVFKTDIGYGSQWFSAEEREDIKKSLGGKVVRELVDHKYHIFQVHYEK